MHGRGLELEALFHRELLTRNPGHDPAEMPQVLTLGFSTADVVVTGWRLERAAEFLQTGTLAAVKTIPIRHVAMTGNRPAVVAIEIRAVGRGKGGL